MDGYGCEVSVLWMGVCDRCNSLRSKVNTGTPSK